MPPLCNERSFLDLLLWIAPSVMINISKIATTHANWLKRRRFAYFIVVEMLEIMWDSVKSAHINRRVNEEVLRFRVNAASHVNEKAIAIDE